MAKVRNQCIPPPLTAMLMNFDNSQFSYIVFVIYSNNFVSNLWQYILYACLFHKCIKIIYKTANRPMHEVFLWLVKISPRWEREREREREREGEGEREREREREREHPRNRWSGDTRRSFHLQSGDQAQKWGHARFPTSTVAFKCFKTYTSGVRGGKSPLIFNSSHSQ